MSARTEIRLYCVAGSLLLALLVIAPIACAGNTLTVTGYISPHQKPDSSFTASPTSGTAPLTVQFTDLSTGSPTAWQWDFENDGTTDSVDKNPPHIYTHSGTYSVRLRVTSATGSDTEIKTGYIIVAPSDPSPRIADLKVYVNGLSAPQWSKWLLTVQLRNAERSLQKENDHTAVVHMRSFVHNVHVLRWLKIISQSDANYMITKANAIIALIQA